jgi:uncharacterized protein involved in copper resistance
MAANPDLPVEGPPLTARPAEEQTQNASTIDAPEIVEAHEEKVPTDSHALANMDHEEKGAAQMDHGQTEVKDLGWNESASDIPLMVGGLKNEELWTLIRRFNKVR